MVMRSLLNILGNVVRLLVAPFWLPLHWWTRPQGAWVRLRLAPHVVDFKAPTVWWQRWVKKPGKSCLDDIRKLFDLVAADASLQGVLLEIPNLHSGWAECSTLRDLMQTLRASGKKLIAYLPEGGGNREYFVASAADQVWLSPQASLSVLGIAGEFHYPKALLDRLGVELQVFAAGEFKTAAEAMVRETMSEAQKEQMGALLRSRQQELTSAVEQRLGGDGDRVNAFLASAPWTGQRAVEQGYADAVCYPDEVFFRLTGEETPRWVNASKYLRWRQRRVCRPWRQQPYIAVINVHGPIVLHPQVHSRVVTERRAVVAALHKVRKDPNVLGVLLHINSPGGSALASDLIHREVSRCRKHKPVVAYLDDVAASGGYYIAAACDAIVAQPLSITGSIGVISAKPVLSQLFAKVGIHVHALRQAPHADMFSASRELDVEEQAILSREVEQFYRAFVQVVSDGRRLSSQEVDQLARGRVWSGSDAKRRGLVDTLGSVQTAVQEIMTRAQQTGLGAAKTVALRVVPQGHSRMPLWTAQPVQRWEGRINQASDLLHLSLGPEKVFYYALGLPSTN
jgi:protease-4